MAPPSPSKAKAKPKARPGKPGPKTGNIRPGGRESAADGMDDDIRAQLVMRLAMYDSVADVVRWLAEEHGITITNQAVSYYQPETKHSTPKRWVELFNVTRKAFLAEVATIPIAERAVRLRRLDTIYSKQFSKGELGAARETLRQAAEEMGNVYTNVSKTAGTMLVANASDLTPEERRNMLADRLRAAAEKIPAALPKPASEAIVEG